jgi:catechol 2,3-dioxygenase-like lactoylglutathione lyase family enzyme
MIHHVQLACPAGSEERLRAFYGRVLGLTEVEKPPALARRGGCWFRGFGIELHLGTGAASRFRRARTRCAGDVLGPFPRGTLPGWSRNAGTPSWCC